MDEQESYFFFQATQTTTKKKASKVTLCQNHAYSNVQLGENKEKENR